MGNCKAAKVEPVRYVSIHGPDAWDRNDWVTARTFTVEKQNIDQEKPE